MSTVVRQGELVASRPSEMEMHPAMRQLQADLAICAKLRESGFLPAALDSDAKVLAVMMKGREMGLGPMASFAHLYVVSGQVAMDTKALAALFAKRGGDFHVIERAAETCTIDLRARGGEWYRHTVTRAEVDKARWSQSYDKAEKQWKVKPAYVTNPTGMLFWRTLSSGIRVVDPGCALDVLIREEMGDEGPEVVDLETGAIQPAFGLDESEIIEGQARDV